MRRHSLAPGATGADGGGFVSRLQMPQAVSASIRPIVGGSAVGSDGTATEEPASDTDSTDMRPVQGPSTLPRKEGSVQVAVRVRPLLPKEMAARAKMCVVSQNNTVHVPASDKMFTFDHVFPTSTTQKDLYDQVVQPHMDAFLQGFNVTVIAYGQTGSGKTYTMGNDGGQMNFGPVFSQSQGVQPARDNDQEGCTDAVEEHDGVIPRFLHELFARTASDKDSATSHISVSFLEIYGEEIHDLLDQQSRGSRVYPDSLQVRESKGGVWVQGLTEVKVASSAEAAEQMRIGCMQRITGSTSMNEHSSRSHAVFTVKMVRKVRSSRPETSGVTGVLQGVPKRRASARVPLTSDPLGDEDGDTRIVSKLTFVDLAGSERLKKTQAEGDRMKEGIQINVGLLALGNVINALGDERRRSNPRQHVSYRDSKLTRLLQDALGGNSRTLFIACVSPVDSNAAETVNTLQYANRAKNIQNKAVKNVDQRSAELGRLKAVLDVFRRELVRARFLQPGHQIEALLHDPIVAEYLRQLEEYASVNGSGSLDFEFGTLANSQPSSAPSSPSSSICATEPPHSSTSSVPVLGDPRYRSGGSSVHIGSSIDGLRLQHLLQVLNLIRLSLQMKELSKQLSDAVGTKDTRIAELDVRIERKKRVAKVLEETLGRMSTWANTSGASETRDIKFNAAKQRLQSIGADIRKLKDERLLATSRFESIASVLQANVKLKHEEIMQARQAERHSMSDPISSVDILLQAAELKRQFGLRSLEDVSWALTDSENQLAKLLEDDQDASMSAFTFFAEHKRNPTPEFIEEIAAVLQSSISDEDIQTQQAKLLRQRTAIVERILKGWAVGSSYASEEEFIAKHELELRECEDSIRELSEALRYRQDAGSRLSALVDSIDSLQAAKSLIKHLIEGLYAHKRAMMSSSLARELLDRDSPIEATPTEPSTSDIQLPARDDRDEELLAVLDMVRPFSEGALSSAHESIIAAKSADLEKRVGQLEQDASNLRMEKDKLIAALEREQQQNQINADALKRLQHLEEMKKKEEELKAYARQLGLSCDIGGFGEAFNLAMKSFDEQIESAKAKAAEVQARIDNEQAKLIRLQSLLRHVEHVRACNADQEPAVTLAEAEQRVLALKLELEQAALKQVHALCQALGSARHLVAELEVDDVTELDLSSEDDVAVLRNALDILDATARWPHESPGDVLHLLIDSDPCAHDAAELISTQSVGVMYRVSQLLLKEKVRRSDMMKEFIQDIRSRVSEMELRREDVIQLIQTSEAVKTSAGQERDSVMSRLDSWITSGIDQPVTSIAWLTRLRTVLDTMVEVRNARFNALSFVHSTLEEAPRMLQAMYSDANLPEYLTKIITSSSSNQATHQNELRCSRESLKTTVEKLSKLTAPVNDHVQNMLNQLHSRLDGFGVQWGEQLIDFIVGAEPSVCREILHKCIEGDSSQQVEDVAEPTNDSLLSHLDPAFAEYARCFSVSFANQCITSIKSVIADYSALVVSFQAAAERANSLSKIHKMYNDMSALQEEMAAFHAKANRKDRFTDKGYSFLEEERLRKKYGREFAQRRAALEQELNKWCNNEDGKYNLDVLGEQMKTHMMQMLDIDITFIHLDLGRASGAASDAERPSGRRSSKTAAHIGPAASAATQDETTKPSTANVVPRARPGSALTRDASSKKRQVGDPSS